MTSTVPSQSSSFRVNLRPPRRPVYTNSSDEEDNDDDACSDQDAESSHATEVTRRSRETELSSHRLYPVAEKSENAESEGDVSASFVAGSMPDSIYIHRKRASVCEDYVDRVARTPNKSLQKKRSVSTPNLSARKGVDCVKALPLNTRHGTMRKWLDAQMASGVKPPLQPTGASLQLASRVQCTPATRDNLRVTASSVRPYGKENIAPLYKPPSSSHRDLLDSRHRPHAPTGGSHVPRWVPSPAPPLCLEPGRTPSYGRRVDSGMPTASTVSSCSMCVSAGSSECLEIRGRVYTGLKYIARGGSCNVYQAVSPDGAIVAVKIVDLRGLEEEEVAMFKNEVDVLARLQHLQHVVQLIEHEHKPTSSHLCVVLEKGETDFAAYLKERQGRLHPLELRYFFLQMLTAVHSIHCEGIIHSDLKPGNFLLVNGRLKLIDFGIASTLRPEATSVTRLGKAGTYNYISPEAISETYRDDKDGPSIKIGVKSDVWSLGCILYQMAFGKTPFGHILKAHAKERAIRDPGHVIDVPPEGHSCDRILQDVLKRCLVRQPSARASTEELLNHPFLMPNTSAPAASVDNAMLAYRSLSPASKRRMLAMLAEEKP